MAVVGVAEVLVRPSFKSFQSEIGKAVDQATPESGPASPGSRMGQRIATGLKVAGGAAIAGAGVVLGTALTKGFGRLTAIENAQAKLTGLGHDAGTVEGIMRNATAAVKGTAFGLGDAATASAAAVAAGVQPGEELEGVLKLMGDAATIAGTDFTSMATIFNKVKASGKLQGDEILQLSEAGIPILQLLAQELGVTASEVSAMASAGEIDFETFQSAMEAGMGGAALKSGETLQGAFANSMAAIGRFGANLMSGVYPQVKGFFASFIEWMGPVEALGKTIGEKLGAALAGLVTFLQEQAIPAVQGFFGWIRDNQAWLGPLAAGIGGAAAAIGILVGAFKAWAAVTKAVAAAKLLLTTGFVKLNAVMAANPIGIVIVALAGLVAAAVVAYQNFEWFRTIVDGAWAGIKQAAAAAWEGVILPVFEAISGWITGVLVPAFLNFWHGVIVPAWQAISAAVADAWTGVIWPALSAFGSWITGTLAPAIVVFWQGVIVPAFTAIGAAVSTAWTTWIQPALAAFGGFLTGPLPAALLAFWQGVIVPVWAGISAIVAAAWTGVIQPALLALGSFVTDVLGPALVWLWQTVVVPVFSAIGSVIAVAWTGVIQPILTALWSFVTDVLGPTLLWLWTNVVAPVFSAIGGAIAAAWNNVIQPALAAFGDWVVGTLAPAISGFWQNVVEPAWAGIASAVQVAWSAIQAVFGFLSDGLRAVGDVLGGLHDGWSSLWERIREATSTAVDAVVGFVLGLRDRAVQLFGDLKARAESIVSELWERVKSLFSGGVDRVKEFVSDFVNRVVEFFTDLKDRVTARSREAMDGAKERFSSGLADLRRTVEDKIDEVIGFFRDLPQRVNDALGNLGGYLKDSGRALLNGFKDGIEDAFGGVRDAVSGGLSRVRDLFPFSPAKEGPFSGRGYTTYSGRALSRDFADAIADEAGYLRKQAAGFMDVADFSASSRITAGVDLVPLSTRDLLLDASGRLPAALHVAHTVGGPSRSSLERMQLGAPDGRQALTLVLEDGTAFPAYLAGRMDARLRHHVDGLAQPLRQYAGA